MIIFRCSYTARVDSAILEHVLGGKLSLHKRICAEFAKTEISNETALALEKWDDVSVRVRDKAATVEGKRQKAEKKVRKTRLLQREAVRSGSYTYMTTEEKDAKIEREMENDSGSETETDNEFLDRHTVSKSTQ